MSVCLHAVVGTLLIHQGRIATAMRQKPPLNRAPSAGHVDYADGLILPLRLAENMTAFQRCAARELVEETGFHVEPSKLRRLFYYKAEDDCAKTGENGEPGGQHVWGVFAYEIKMISQPTLTDEPGKMHGWDFRSIGTLMNDPELEPIWFDLLTDVARMSDHDRGFELA